MWVLRPLCRLSNKKLAEGVLITLWNDKLCANVLTSI